MRIAIDAMGGDFAPGEIVKGGITAAKEFPSDEIVLVGDQQKIENSVGKISLPNVSILHTTEFIGMDESPSVAFKQKKNSSMQLAAGLVRDKKCDAMVSASNTGALLQVCLFTIGRIKGIKRPALAVFMPTKKNPCMLIDAGANADCKPEYVMQFARIGSIYMNRMAAIAKPRVGLINIGEESGKGNTFYRQLSDEMANAKDLNFTGNAEPSGFFAGNFDVAVADGFTGNIFLKSAEAAAEFMQSVMKEEIKKNFLAKISAVSLLPVFKKMKSRLDHSEHGGALLLGLNGIVVKSHGRADARTIRSACRMAKRIYDQKVQDFISEIGSSESD